MSAELLRRAATILRERAEAVDNREDWREFYEDSEFVMHPAAGRDDAQFIALMSPGFGLELADVLATLAEKHYNAGREELVLHPDDPCEVCEGAGGHEVDVCGGCYPMWEDLQAHAVYPCAEVRRVLTLARLIVGESND